MATLDKKSTSRNHRSRETSNSSPQATCTIIKGKPSTGRQSSILEAPRESRSMKKERRKGSSGSNLTSQEYSSKNSVQLQLGLWKPSSSESPAREASHDK